MSEKYKLNKIKPNKSSILYMYEIWAIPKKIRLAYLYNLLRRKGAANNKNVILLRLIYEQLDNEDFHSWDTSEICFKCKFKTANQLYWYKTRILKDLRELFFNWKKHDQEIERLYENKTCKIGLMYEKALKMIEIGMLKEANFIFLEILKKKKRTLIRNNDSENKLMLATIYYHMSVYYYTQGNYKKLKIYHGKFDRLSRKCRKISGNNNNFKRIRIISLILKASRLLNNNLCDLSTLDIKKKLEDALKYSTGSKNIDLRLEILYRLSEQLILNFSRTDEGMKEARSHLAEGLNLAKLNGYKDYELNFRSKSASLRKISQYLKPTRSSKLSYYYEKIEEQYAASASKIRALDTLAFTYNEFSIESNSNIGKLIKLHLLRGQKRIAFFHLYFNYQFSAEQNLYNISKRQFNGEEIVYLEKVNSEELLKVTKSFETYDKKINLIHNAEFKVYSILNRILYGFLKGKFSDYEYMMNLIRKFESYKKKNLFFNEEIINHVEFLKISIQMFEESRKYNSKKIILGKYLEKFNMLCETMMLEKTHTIGLTDKYLFMTFVSHILGYPELWLIVLRSWTFLKTNYPTVTESLHKQLTSTVLSAA